MSLGEAEQCRPLRCNATVTLQLKLMMTGVKLKPSHPKSSQSPSRHRATADETAWGTPGTGAKQRTEDEVKIRSEWSRSKSPDQRESGQTRDQRGVGQSRVLVNRTKYN